MYGLVYDYIKLNIITLTVLSNPTKLAKGSKRILTTTTYKVISGYFALNSMSN